MARYSRVALYNKAKNATHNHPNLIPTYYKKDIVQIPEAKNEPVDFLHKQADKKEQMLKPAVENVTTAEKDTKMPAKVKRSVKKSASAKPKKKAVSQKTKKASAVVKKSVKKASTGKAKKATAKPKAKKSMVSKKSVKKSASKTSSKAVSSKKMSAKKPVKKMAGSNKKNTKPVLKRQTKKSK